MWAPLVTFSGGEIDVQTELPYYEPGQTVNGKVFIVTTRPVYTSGIVIEISGKEKNKFTRFWTERQQYASSEKGKSGPVKIIEHA